MGNYSRKTRFKGIDLMQGQSPEDGPTPEAGPKLDTSEPSDVARPSRAPEGDHHELMPSEPESATHSTARHATEPPVTAPESSESARAASDGEPEATTKDVASDTAPSGRTDAPVPKRRRSEATGGQDGVADIDHTSEQIAHETDATAEAAPSADSSSPEPRTTAPKKRSSRSRQRKPDSGEDERAKEVTEPATLVELLVTMVGSKASRPTKKVVKGAKPTEGIGPDDVTAIRAAVSEDPDFATPVAFLRAVLLSSPSKRAVQQALDIAEQCLIAHHISRGATDDASIPDHTSSDWLVGRLSRILGEAKLAPSARRSHEDVNLIRTLVVLLSARGKIPPENVPAILVAVDGRAALETQPSEPSEMQSAMNAMGFAALLHGDQLSHQTLIAAAVHIEGARLRTKQSEARAAELARRAEQAEQLSSRLTEETKRAHTAVVEAETARDELQREMSGLRQESKTWLQQNEELKAALAELKERSAEERERSEQRRIDDSNAFEALRAATSRNRRKDLELLAEAAAALEKDPPKPHVAADRIALVLRSMERERESLRPQDACLSDPEGTY